MDLEKKIGEIYNILIQFEKIGENNVSEDTYRSYLDRLWVWYNGFGNVEIANSIKGLEALGQEADHDTVRRTVFHLISLLKRIEG